MKSKLRISRFVLNEHINCYFIIFFSFSLILNFQIFAQGEADFNPAKNPVAPSVYQFIKLNEMPVDEYSGQPNVVIPIFEITSGTASLPLTLQYQASGIKVNEEASCVGLGWTLPIGNITQVVQDRDDFATNSTRLFPDYFEGYPYPTYFPYRFDCSPAWGNYTPPTSYGITNPLYQYIVYPDYRLSFNNVYTYLPQFFGVGNGGYNAYDSEPDMFNISLNGLSLSFIVDKDMEIKTLNDIGGEYIISYINMLNPKTGFKIVAPNGNQYFFEAYSEVKNEMSSSKTIYSYGQVEANGIINEDVVSRIWYLTKIIEANKSEILLSYSETSYIKNLSSVSQLYKWHSLWFSSDVCAAEAVEIDEVVNGALTEEFSKLVNHKSSTGQKLKYCNSILFDEGEVKFVYSQRTDIANDLKLDSIFILDKLNQIKKTCSFLYYYNISDHALQEFANTEIEGNRKTETELRNRLMLREIKINQDLYNFQYYEENSFPAKHSFSTDYWGYSNGVLSNSTWIPKPSHLGLANIPDNSENHSSNIQFTKTLTLKSIQYPTGAFQTFIYEPHTFTSDYHPEISEGFGLRIHEILTTDENNFISKRNFEYNNGKLLTPMVYSSEYEENYLVRYTPIILCTVGSNGNSERGHLYRYRISSINSSNFFSQTSYVNLRKIGYDAVVSRIMKNEIINGEIRNYYTNELNNNPTSYFYENENNLPLGPNYFSHQNGSLIKAEIYDQLGNKVVETNYSYESISSTLYYGAKTSNYRTYSCSVPADYYDVNFKFTSLNLVSYYPIYARETYPTLTETIRWINNLPVIERDRTQYDSKRQISSKSLELVNENQVITTKFFYPYNFNTNNSYSLIPRNIINIPIHISKEKNNNFIESRTTDFGIFHGLILPTKVKTITHDLTEKVDYNFNAYDNKGNLLLWQIPPSFYTSRIYDEGKNQILANITNSTLDETGHTSFENNELNGWTKFDANEFETMPANVFTGKSSMKVTGASGPFQIFTVGQNAEKHSGYKASVWAKGEGAYLHIEVNGEWSSHVKVKNEINDGLWHKLEVELPRHKIQPYFSQGHNLKIKVYVGTERGTVYFDDLRFHPSDAQMTTYTHEPLIGVTSISNESNKPEFYIYDSFGRLEYIKDFEGNIIKKNDYHYRTNGQ